MWSNRNLQIFIRSSPTRRRQVKFVEAPPELLPALVIYEWNPRQEAVKWLLLSVVFLKVFMVLTAYRLYIYSHTHKSWFNTCIPSRRSILSFAYSPSTWYHMHIPMNIKTSIPSPMVPENTAPHMSYIHKLRAQILANARGSPQFSAKLLCYLSHISFGLKLINKRTCCSHKSHIYQPTDEERRDRRDVVLKNPDNYKSIVEFGWCFFILLCLVCGRVGGGLWVLAFNM